MKTSTGTAVASVGLRLNPTTKAALILLNQAYDTAASLDQDSWDFAIEIHALKESGLTHNDLRSLVCCGFVEHRLECTQVGAKRRSFRESHGLRLVAESCFVLSGSGLKIARGLSGVNTGTHSVEDMSPTKTLSLAITPVWDAVRRELRFGFHVVKQFKVPAPSQELILDAFEEEGWPVHLDDPLPPRYDLDAKRRLHAVIDRLNRNQKHKLIRFHGDGTGTGISWEELGTAD